jgi:hypothetical protein
LALSTFPAPTSFDTRVLQSESKSTRSHSKHT